MSLVIDNFSTIVEMFDKLFQKYKGNSRPFLKNKISGKWISYTFDNIKTSVEEFACGLSIMNVKRKDRVAIISENRPEWVISDLAIASLGAISVPLYTTLTSHQIEEIFLNAEVSVAIVSNSIQLKKLLPLFERVPSLHTVIIYSNGSLENSKNIFSFEQILEIGKNNSNQKKISELSSEIKSQDVLTIIYTSGTTGVPKGVVLTHHNLVSNIKSTAQVLPMDESDTFLSFLPLCHSFERMGGYYTASSCGGTIAYAESVETVRENLKEIFPTVVAGVPRFYEKIQNRILKNVLSSSKLKQKLFWKAIETGKKFSLAKRKGNISLKLKTQYKFFDKLVFEKIKAVTGKKIKYFVSGGGPLSKETGDFFEAIGLTIIEGYGLTETSPVLTVNRLNNYKYGTVGMPIPDVKIKIADDGEILAFGPNIMKCYWNNEIDTNEVIDKEGWFHTGDIGEFDENGFLKITDRKKNIFVSSGGKNIAPQPIENLFLQSEIIDQCLLIGDARDYLIALIVPDFETLKLKVEQVKLKFQSIKEMVSSEKVKAIFKDEIDLFQKKLAKYERVRKFILLGNPFSVEDGDLTPTMKIKRKVVEIKYKNEIEKIYNERDNMA